MNKKKYNKWIDDAVRYIEDNDVTYELILDGNGIKETYTIHSGMCKALMVTQSSIFSSSVSIHYINKHMPLFNYDNFKLFININYETIKIEKYNPNKYWINITSPLCKEARIQFLKSLKK